MGQHFLQSTAQLIRFVQVYIDLVFGCLSYVNYNPK
jgi:hypothetical protein